MIKDSVIVDQLERGAFKVSVSCEKSGHFNKLANNEHEHTCDQEQGTSSTENKIADYDDFTRIRNFMSLAKMDLAERV